jgi:DNA topoisomerase-2
MLTFSFLTIAVATKSGIVENLLSWAEFKLKKDLKKTDGTKRSNILGIPKLDDANDAGGKESDKCTLILTEGDSAKALAVSKCQPIKCQ